MSRLAEQEAPGARLERLMAEFTRKPGVGATAVAATLNSRGLNGAPERR